MAFWDKWLSENKSDVTAPASALSTPAVDNRMSSAVAQGDPAKVQALLAAGADINQKDTGGMTALHLAVMTGNRDVIKTLLDVGGKVDFNTVAVTPAEDAAPTIAPEAAPDTGDIEIRKPLTFKRKG